MRYSPSRKPKGTSPSLAEQKPVKVFSPAEHVQKLRNMDSFQTRNPERMFDKIQDFDVEKDCKARENDWQAKCKKYEDTTLVMNMPEIPKSFKYSYKKKLQSGGHVRSTSLL